MQLKYLIKNKKNKFGALKTSNGFPSKLEESVYKILLLRERAGEIKNIRRQHKVIMTNAQISWKVDFSAETIDGELFFIEAKGIETSDYKIKKKLWKFYGHGRLEVWTGTYNSPILKEIIEPKFNSCRTCGKI